MSGPNFKLYSETEKGSSTHLLDTKAFSKQVQNFRNSLIMTFNDSYQKGVTREVRRKFSELMVKYFRTNFKHLHNLNSIPNFMEGLRSTISIFVSEIKVNEETKLDDGILSKLFLKCRDLEKSLKNKLSTNLIDDTPRTFAKSFYEFHQEDFEELTDKVRDFILRRKVFNPKTELTPDEINRIDNNILELIAKLGEIFAFPQENNTRKVDIGDLKAQIAITICNILESSDFDNIDESKYSKKGIEELAGIMIDYVNLISEKDEIETVADFMEMHDALDKRELDFVAGMFALRKKVEDNVKSNTAFHAKYIHSTSEDVDNALWIVKLFFNMFLESLGSIHNLELLDSAVKDFDSALIDFVQPSEGDTTRIMAYDLISEFQHEIEKVLRDHLIYYLKIEDLKPTKIKNELDDTPKTDEDTLH